MDQAAYDAMKAKLADALAMLESHKNLLSEAAAALEAEFARVPTFADVKALIAKVA